MNTSNLDLQTLIASINVAEQRYLAKEPVDMSGKPITSSDDLRAARRFLNERICAAVDKLNNGYVSPDKLLSHIQNDMPVKAIKRMCEFFAAVTGENYQLLDSVTMLSLIVAAFAGGNTRDALHFAVTGKGDDNTSAIVKNTAIVRKAQHMINKVGIGSVNTKLSRSFGINGFCKYLGLGEIQKGTTGRELVAIDQNNPFFVRSISMIEKASNETLDLMKGMNKKDKKVKK